MTLQQQFQDLNNRLSTRKELEKLLIAAKLESNSEIIFRISKVFNAFPEKNEFVLTIKPFQENGLLGAIHTGDYKEALDDCGRLRKGYKFLNGRIAKVEPKKPVATKTTTRSKVAKRILAETPKKVKQQIIKTAIKLVEKPVLKVTDVLNISILKIFTDEKRFQNRNKLNETVLAQIMENYSSQKFDAIVIWHDPKLKKDFVLAGHHRFEAVKRLGKKFVMTKYFNGSEAEAIKYAKVESNANRSLELPQERANIYREMFVKGMSKKCSCNALSRYKVLSFL